MNNPNGTNVIQQEWDNTVVPGPMFPVPSYPSYPNPSYQPPVQVWTNFPMYGPAELAAAKAWEAIAAYYEALTASLSDRSATDKASHD